MEGYCEHCGCYGTVEKHHIFGGSLRKKSEHYKAIVYLCPHCHRDNKDGVHNNAEFMQQLHEAGQVKLMFENNWTIEDFRREFYKNYLDENITQEELVNRYLERKAV